MGVMGVIGVVILEVCLMWWLWLSAKAQGWRQIVGTRTPFRVSFLAGPALQLGGRYRASERRPPARSPVRSSPCEIRLLSNTLDLPSLGRTVNTEEGRIDNYRNIVLRSIAIRQNARLTYAQKILAERLFSRQHVLVFLGLCGHMSD